jgi:O-antigen ligase
MNVKIDLSKFTILIAIMTSLLVSPLFLFPFGNTKFIFFIFAMFILTMLLAFNFKNLVENQSKVPLLVSLIFGASLLINLFTTEQPYITPLIGSAASKNGLLAHFGFLLTFLIMVYGKSNKVEIFLFKSLSYLGLFFAVYGIAQYFGFDVARFQAGPKSGQLYGSGTGIILTLGNTNYVSLVFVITIISTIFILTSFNLNKIVKLILVISTLSQLVLVFLIGDTLGTVIVSFSIFLILKIMIKKIKVYQNYLSKIWWVLFGTGTIFGALGIFGFGFFEKILYKESFVDRLYTWKIGLDIIRDNLFFGIGLDSFVSGYALYRTDESVMYRRMNYDSYVDNAHNFLIQYFATGGILVFTAYCLYLFLILYCVLKTIKSGHNVTTINWLFIAWFAIQLYTFVGVSNIVIQIWGWIIGGVLVKYSLNYLPTRNSNNSTKSKYRTIFKFWFPALRLGLISSSLWLLFFSINYASSDLKFVSARQDLLISRNNMTEFNLNNIYNSARNIPSLDHKILAARILANSGMEREALELGNQSIEMFPHLLPGWDFIATIYEQSGRKELSLFYRQQTIKLDPLNPRFKELLRS